MVQADALRSAVKWSAADEAQSRISAVKRALDAADGSGGPSTAHAAAASKQHDRAAAGAAASAGRQELRQGLSELDAVRSFLQENLNTANRQYLSTGAKDEQLQSALQHGLSELEDVRRRLVRTLSTSASNTAQQGQAPSTTRNGAQPAPPRGRAGSATGRPPSATRRAAGGGPEDAAKKAALQDHARRLFRGGGNSRPSSATVRPSAAAAGESLHGTSDGLQFTASRLSQRPSSATVRSASQQPTAPSAAAGSNAAPPRRSSSEGPRLMTGARARPTSAPVNRGNNSTATQNAAKTGTPSAPTSSSDNNSTNAANAGNAQWAKYQDWAQKVMTSVHSRRVMKHREALERERHQQQGGPLRRTASATAGTTTSTTANNNNDATTTAAAGPSPPTVPSDTDEATPPSTPVGGAANAARAAAMNGASANAPKPSSTASTATTSAAAQRQRPQSAAFSSLRRAQAAASTTGPSARPMSATVRGAHATTTAPSVVGASAGRLDSTAQSLREQGNVAFQQKRFAEAAEAYGKAITLEPTSELLYCNRAAAQLMLGKYHSALADAQAAIEIDPTHIKAHWRAAKACLYLGQTDQARSLYGQAQKLAELQADKDAIAAEARAADLVDRCRRYIRLREYHDALKAADDVLQIFPPTGPCSMPWLCLRCEAEMHIDAANALSCATRYTSEDPQCAEAWFLRGKAVFYTGHDAASTSAALGFLARCREVDPKHSRASVLQSSIDAFAALRDQGNSAYAGGRWQEAYVAYTKCLAVDPYNQSLKAIILCNRSAVCIQCERWKDALDDITQSINCNPQNAKAFTRRARIFQQQGNLDASIKDLQHAAQLFPSAENQERLQQAVDQRNRAHQQQQQQQQQQAGARPPNGAGSSFRYFNFANGSSAGNAGGGGPSRPSTAGASRPSHGSSGGGGASRPQSASNGRGSNPYSIPRPNSASTASSAAPKEPSHYEVLGIARMADEKAVTRAYRDAALKWHPDKWMSATDGEKTRAEEMFKRISTAYATLKDATKRRQYDHSQF